MTYHPNNPAVLVERLTADADKMDEELKKLDERIEAQRQQYQELRSRADFIQTEQQFAFDEILAIFDRQDKVRRDLSSRITNLRMAIRELRRIAEQMA